MVGPHKSSAQEFARCLRQRLRQMKLSRQELAETMGVSVATIGNWARGRGFPCLRYRSELCTLLAMTAEELHLPPYDEHSQDETNPEDSE